MTQRKDGELYSLLNQDTEATFQLSLSSVAACFTQVCRKANSDHRPMDVRKLKLKAELAGHASKDVNL